MDVPNYKEFAQWAIREGAWDGCDLDGAMIQQKAVELGIVKQVPYDPEVHGESEFDCPPGDPWFVFVD